MISRPLMFYLENAIPLSGTVPRKMLVTQSLAGGMCRFFREHLEAMRSYGHR